MRGSYSIKAVLPALALELSYDDLEIKEGGSASTIFTKWFLEDLKVIIPRPEETL